MKSKYPNYRLLEKRKFQKMKELSNICEICKGPADEIHHIDFDPSNHNYENLGLVCKSCHGKIHTGRTNTSKYVRLYGMNLAEMEKAFKRNLNYFRRLHNKNLLSSYLLKKKEGKELEKIEVYKKKIKIVKRQSKWIRLYGLSLSEIYEKTGMTIKEIVLAHRKGELKEKLLHTS
jgi:hypothetical protein